MFIKIWCGESFLGRGNNRCKGFEEENYDWIEKLR